MKSKIFKIFKIVTLDNSVYYFYLYFILWLCPDCWWWIKSYSKRPEKRILISLKMPNFGELLYTVPDELKSLFRSLERISKKIIMSKWSLKFNRTCLTENILPKYSHILLSLCGIWICGNVPKLCVAMHITSIYLFQLWIHPQSFSCL